MNLEIALWVLGAGCVPALAFCIWLYTCMSEVSRSTNTLIEMHQHADEHGFGTKKLEKVLSALANSTRAMAHYTKWMAEQLTGKTPPPPIDAPHVDL